MHRGLVGGRGANPCAAALPNGRCIQSHAMLRAKHQSLSSLDQKSSIIIFQRSQKGVDWISAQKRAKRRQRSPVACSGKCRSGGDPCQQKFTASCGRDWYPGAPSGAARLDEGYEVRCIVRPRPKPGRLPAGLGAGGDPTIIDCATARPEENIQKVDWEGKVALIQCAQAMGIQRYVFFSIFDCDKNPEVPLLQVKSCTEKFLQSSGLNYTTFRLCGFMQAIIGNYAVSNTGGERGLGDQRPDSHRLPRLLGCGEDDGWQL
eukprot:jgi/Botrbrau1/11216/Bobra.0075s0012.1